MSHTKRAASVSPTTPSPKCGSLFTCSGALLFRWTKTAKLQNPCISGHGLFDVQRQTEKKGIFQKSLFFSFFLFFGLNTACSNTECSPLNSYIFAIFVRFTQYFYNVCAFYAIFLQYLCVLLANAKPLPEAGNTYIGIHPSAHS
jgi:hypothetical protein